LTLLHRRIEVRIKVLDAARNLAAHIDGDHGLQAARGAHAGYHHADFGDGRLVVGGGVGDLGAAIQQEHGGEADCDQPGEADACELFEQVRYPI
jgi:hypothetical protein